MGTALGREDHHLPERQAIHGAEDTTALTIAQKRHFIKRKRCAVPLFGQRHAVALPEGVWCSPKHEYPVLDGFSSICYNLVEPISIHAMKKSLFYGITIVLLFCLSAGAQEWQEVTSRDRVTLPRDLYVQSGYRIQWWYFTGHLLDTGGRPFGFEVTFFVVGVQKRPFRSKFGIKTLYLTNFAISDIEGKKFYHFSNADSGAYGFAGADGSRLHVWVGKDTLEGDLARMHIKAHAQDADLDLVLALKKPIITNGNKGYSRKSEESPRVASLYFSCTDLETKGTIKLGSTLFTVHGKSWFDREISSHGLAKNEAGWDWFAIQLDDGREIMIYELRKKDGSIDRYSAGTLVDTVGNIRHLKRDDYRIKVISTYTSKMTGIRYPSKWEIIVPSEHLSLQVTPLLEDQEFTGDQAMGRPYWEGTCSVEGSARGEAYTEMTGYQIIGETP